MISLTTRRTILKGLVGVGAATAVSGFPFVNRAGAHGDPSDRHHRAKHLYIWAGDQARIAPDFVAVINFDESSPHYGKVINTAPVPTSGNEAHHLSLSADGQTLACGGLLSLLRDQDGIFFFDVSTPDDPKFIKSTRAPLSAVTDDFYALPGGGFLVTQMGSNTGGAPGRLAEFDADLNLVKEWPEVPPADGFNPHGLSVRPEINLMVTSDFINPISTINGVPGGPELRGAIRVWDLAARRIVRSIFIPTALGTMDVRLIPGDKKRRAFTAGMFDGLIYLVNTLAGTAAPVFDTTTINGMNMEMPQVVAITHNATRLIVPLFGSGQIVMLDISRPERPKLLSVVNLGSDAGPHDIGLTGDDKRLIVTDYFLDQDDFGKIHFDGDHKVHILKVQHAKLELDTRFNLDFNTAFASGPARPHGMASK
jgi:selenium-binding protein 1